MTLTGANPTPLRIPTYEDGQLNFLESVEAAHASHGTNARVAALLGITRPPIRMDSQAKYCALSRGDGGVYLRMPVGTGYVEKIWVRTRFPSSILYACIADLACRQSLL